MINILWIFLRTKYDVHYYISAIMHRSGDDWYPLNYFQNEAWCALLHFSHFASLLRLSIPSESFQRTKHDLHVVCWCYNASFCRWLIRYVTFRMKHDMTRPLSAMIHRSVNDYLYLCPLNHFSYEVLCLIIYFIVLEMACALIHFSLYASFCRWLIPYDSFQEGSMICMLCVDAIMHCSVHDLLCRSFSERDMICLHTCQR